jgi:hypothetical protein
MQVTNLTSETIIAFGWHKQLGLGDKVTVRPGKTVDVCGPSLSDLDGSDSYMPIPGKISCQQELDNGTNFQVTQGHQLNLQDGDLGITVRHCKDKHKVIELVD